MNIKLLSKIQANLSRMLYIFSRSTVVRNAASLYLIQFANYIIPLITVPYLVRVLGPAGYGAVAFAQGFINYLMLFVEYGFNWSATRKISVHREDPQTINYIAFHVWAAKGLLSLIGFIVLLLCIIFVPKLREVSWLLLALYGVILGDVLFPIWLFQGMERMVAISIINLGARLAILVGVFALVHHPEDALIYAALIGGGSVIAGLIGMVVSVRMFRLKLVRVSWSGIFATLKEGWVLFLSKASVSLYTAGNAFILGMLTNHTVVGYYSAAEKIVRALVSLFDPITQSVYPAMVRKVKESKEQALYWARIGLCCQSFIGSVMSIFLFIFAAPLVQIILGTQYVFSITLVKILAPLPLLIAIGSSLGRFIMLPFGLDYERFVVFIIAGCFNILSGIILSKMYGAIGMAITVATSELLVTVGFWIFTTKRGLNPWRRVT